MNRRSNEVMGYVNFPVDSDDWKNTMEGGMTVKIIVPVPLEDKFSQCCKSEATEFEPDVLVGSDVGLERKDYYNSYFLPRFINLKPCYAIVTIGSTGWSGYNDSKGYWKCTYKDLLPDGKALYDSLQKLYNVRPHILTYLDT